MLFEFEYSINQSIDSRFDFRCRNSQYSIHIAVGFCERYLFFQYFMGEKVCYIRILPNSDNTFVVKNFILLHLVSQ